MENISAHIWEALGGAVGILIGIIALLLKLERNSNEKERVSNKEERIAANGFKTSVLEKMSGFEVAQTKLSGSIDGLSANIKTSGEQLDERIRTINRRLDHGEDDGREAKDNFDELHTRVWSLEMQAEAKGWKIGGKRGNKKKKDNGDDEK